MWCDRRKITRRRFAPPNGHDPLLVGAIAAHQVEESGHIFSDHRKIRFHFWVEKNPGRFHVIELDRLDGVRHGIAEDARPRSRAAIGHIGLRILREHFQFLPVAQIHPHKPSRIGVQRGMDDQALAIRREPGDERSADHLPVEERLLEGHYNEIAPWFVDRVAHPDERVPAFPIEGRRRADDKIVVRRPCKDVARIGRLERDGARFEIDAIHVEGLRVTAVQGHEDELRMLQVGQDILRPHAGERGQVAHLVVRQVGGEKVIDFVARVVLEIKDVF